jgi:hypothetical protein
MLDGIITAQALAKTRRTLLEQGMGAIDKMPASAEISMGLIVWLCFGPTRTWRVLVAADRIKPSVEASRFFDSDTMAG